MDSRIFELVAPWPGLKVIAEVAEGNRNQVWRGEIGGDLVSVRRSRRTPESLAWELDLIDQLARQDFFVPTVVRTFDRRVSAGGLVVQRWLDGLAPESDADWQAVAAELQRLHSAFCNHAQRPGCCVVTELKNQRRSVDADLDAMPPVEQQLVIEVFDRFREAPTSVIHGDPDPSNIRIGPDGRVGLLDWDESRVDVTWHDLSNLGIDVLDTRDNQTAEHLSNAWEAANGWVAEPSYARRRLAALRER